MRTLLTLAFISFSSLAFAENFHCLLSANFYTHDKQTMEIDCPRDQETEDAFHAQQFKTLAQALDFVGDRGFEIEVMAPHDISHAAPNFIMGYTVIFKKEKE